MTIDQQVRWLIRDESASLYSDDEVRNAIKATLAFELINLTRVSDTLYRGISSNRTGWMDSLSDYPIIVKVDGIETPVTLSDPLHREVRFSTPIDPHSTVVAEAWAGNPYFAAADLLEQSAGDPDKQTLIIAQGNIKFLDGKSPAESLRDQAALLRLRGMPVSIGLGGFR